MSLSTTAAKNALRTSQSHVSMTTQPLMLDFGRCHLHLLALQTAVAVKVSGEQKMLEIPFSLNIKLSDGFLDFSLKTQSRVM